MKGEHIAPLNVAVYREIWMPDQSRLVLSEPIQPRWDDIELANHNVFRLNKRNELVWQVRRAELPDTTPWAVMHERARRWHAHGSPDGAHTAMGFLDPFTSMNLDERPALDPEPKGVWRLGCVVYLITHWWSYVLDPETGIATCTGDQVK